MPQFWKTLWFKILAGVTLLAAVFVIAITVNVRWAYRDRMHKPADVPVKPIIMILGASLKPDGQPSDYLADRLKVGAELYKQGKAMAILVTGDDGLMKTNEIQVMRQTLVQAGVPEPVMLFDGHGYRTYESCSRAKSQFGVTQAIIVTQDFHLPRALYLCNHLGVDAVGASADSRTYKDLWWNLSRDWLASFKAWIDINLWPPKPPVKYE